jgi:hypothetical protein
MEMDFDELLSWHKLAMSRFKVQAALHGAEIND